MTNLDCFVAERNRMRQQVADRSPQRHATLPTFHKILLQYYPVLQSTQAYYSALQSVLRTTKCYSSTTLYYTALLCSTNYYSSTTLYYKVLLQYYSVLHSTTPVLLCTTQCYSSTTLYYKVLLQYYSVLQSTTLYYKLTKYCACHEKWPSKISKKFAENGWNVISNARPIRPWSENDPSMIRPWNRQSATRLATEVPFHAHHEHFVLKNTTFRAPAIIPNFTEYCACHEKWHLNFTKYCACHKKWISWLILDTNETLFTMRRATCVIVQTHQILRLPRKMNLMIDPWHKWNVIYNARSNMRHCPNSPNTAPATKNESHDWSLTQMKRYLQCAEQHASLSKLTKYCACHEKWISWLILDTNETLFTMRGATCVIVQTHQILRLPRKMTVQNLKEICWKRMKRHFQCAADPTMIRAWSDHDPSMIRPWNRQSATRLATEVTFHAHHEHFVLKNTTFRAPAIIPNFSEYCACHEKWHLHFTKYCACHEKWHLHFTKYCACHKKWISWLILDTNETLFTMRGATCVIVQTHQILRLPRKMNLMIDPWHKWNVIYNARSNMRHSPNSPNTAPATKNDRPKSQRNLLKTDETSFPMRGRSDHDPSMIRPWSEHDPTMKPSVRNPPRNRGDLSRPPRAFCIEKYNISRSGYHSKFHRILRLPRKVTLALHQILRLPRKVTLALHQILRLPREMNLMIDPWHKWNVIYNARSNMRHSPNSPNTAPATKNDRPKSQRNLLKTHETSFPMRGRSDHDPSMIRPWSEHDPTMKPSVRNPPRNRGDLSRPPRAFCIEKYNISRSGYHSKFHRILRLPRKVTLALHQILRLPRKVTLALHQILRLPQKVTLALHEQWHLHFNKYWVKYYLTELWLDWAVTWLSCDLTELLLNWAVTWLSYYLTELWLDWLWLDWAVTWLSHYLTELWLDWAVTWQSYYLTELWLDWAVTWLSCDLTELWLDWAVTWLSCDLTELLLDWAVTWLSCDLTELWLDRAIT